MSPPRLRWMETEAAVWPAPPAGMAAGGVHAAPAPGGDAARQAAEVSYRTLADHVLRFDVYGPRILTAEVPGGRVRAGVGFVQRIRIGPLRIRGPVRVLAVWDSPAARPATVAARDPAPAPPDACAGFTYEALPGHVERGTATFEAVRRGERVLLRITSESAPANGLLALGTPFARFMQHRAYRTGARRMAAMVQGRQGQQGQQRQATPQ